MRRFRKSNTFLLYVSVSKIIQNVLLRKCIQDHPKNVLQPHIQDGFSGNICCWLGPSLVLINKYLFQAGGHFIFGLEIIISKTFVKLRIVCNYVSQCFPIQYELDIPQSPLGLEMIDYNSNTCVQSHHHIPQSPQTPLPRSEGYQQSCQWRSG